MAALSIQRSLLDYSMIKVVFDSDQSVYPAPLTLTRLLSWVWACPELSIWYSIDDADQLDQSTAAGVIIVLPLKENYWRRLLQGALKETDINPDSMFAHENDSENQVGLHIFHVEKFKTWNRCSESFVDVSLADVTRISQKMGWRVLGFSALAATTSGYNSLMKRYFKPTGYSEYFVRKAGAAADRNLEMFSVLSKLDAPDADLISQPGDDLVNKSIMMVRLS